ncbi:MAG: carbohydrate ABC transporter substrate-binding protein, partial [Hungatella sp.]|nr:carbohydrate ABC transporter substrate-binding protein [Hungatella sp.]
MKLKRLNGILMAALMTAGTLAGCSGSKADATTAAAGGQPAAQTGAEQTQSGSGEKTVITVWSKDRHDATYVQKKVDEYNAGNTDNV